MRPNFLNLYGTQYNVHKFWYIRIIIAVGLEVSTLHVETPDVFKLWYIKPYKSSDQARPWAMCFPQAGAY